MDINTLISQSYRSGVYVLKTPKSSNEIQKIAESFGYTFFYLRGADVHNKEDLFKTVKKLLNLPSWVGENWDAFYDSLTGFPWEPANGYVMLYDDVGHFAANPSDDFYIALRHLHTAGVDTDHNSKFYVLLDSGTTVLPREFAAWPYSIE